jgi:hypothetical protein
MLFSRLPSRLSGVILSILPLGGGIQKQRFLSQMRQDGDT